MHADPAPASDAVLQQALQSAREVPTPAPPALPNLSTGYRIGQRIPVGYQYEAAITQNAVFSLPVDPLSGFCALGALPVGFGVDAPHASSVRTLTWKLDLLECVEDSSHRMHCCINRVYTLGKTPARFNTLGKTPARFNTLGATQARCKA